MPKVESKPKVRIRLRWLTGGSEYQVLLGRKVIHRADFLEQARKWIVENGYEVANGGVQV